jgi:phage shock protein A
MNGQHNEILSNLRHKIKSIISLYEHEREKTKSLDAEKDELKEEIKVLEIKIKELETKYNNAILAKSIISSESDAHDAKIKVNRIVREIDKCIALLNR